MRRLLLAVLAAAIGVFAAALLRAERRVSGGDGEEATGGGRCVARTRAGEPCSRAAEPGSDRCWQHR